MSIVPLPPSNCFLLYRASSKMVVFYIPRGDDVIYMHKPWLIFFLSFSSNLTFSVLGHIHQGLDPLPVEPETPLAFYIPRRDSTSPSIYVWNQDVYSSLLPLFMSPPRPPPLPTSPTPSLSPCSSWNLRLVEKYVLAVTCCCFPLTDLYKTDVIVCQLRNLLFSLVEMDNLSKFQWLIAAKRSTTSLWKLYNWLQICLNF